MNFVTIDFELANPDRASVCSLGIVIVKNGKIIDKYSMLIRPKELYFDPFYTEIHGITANDVKNKPKFNELWPEIKPLLEEQMIIAHYSSFDMSVLRHVLDAYNISYPTFSYSCSYIISKKSWPGLLNYKLHSVAQHLRIDFIHHDALEDAHTCAEIVINACKLHGAGNIEQLADILKFKNGSFSPDGYKPAKFNLSSNSKINPKLLKPNNNNFDIEHPFYGKHIVFTGTLLSMPRKEAMQKVINVGGICESGVTEQTNYLVVGLQDLRKFRDGDKSNKQKKAEALLAKGLDIEMISEDDFLRML